MDRYLRPFHVVLRLSRLCAAFQTIGGFSDSCAGIQILVNLVDQNLEMRKNAAFQILKCGFSDSAHIFKIYFILLI